MQSGIFALRRRVGYDDVVDAGHEGGTAADAGFIEDVFEVELDGVDADVEEEGDLSIGMAAGHKRGGFLFSWAQGIQFVHGLFNPGHLLSLARPDADSSFTTK
jgi:hypothetical protein